MKKNRINRNAAAVAMAINEITIADIARELDLMQWAARKIVRGETSVSDEMLAKVADIFTLRPEKLLQEPLIIFRDGSPLDLEKIVVG